jgi:hypothetical protein
VAKESATTTASESDKSLTTAKESIMGAEFIEETSTQIKASAVKQSIATEAPETNNEPASIKGSAVNKPFSGDEDLGADEESTAVASKNDKELATAEDNKAS